MKYKGNSMLQIIYVEQWIKSGFVIQILCMKHIPLFVIKVGKMFTLNTLSV